MKRLKQITPYLVLLLFILFAYRAVLFTADTFIPWDLPLFHVPHALFASESLRSGQLPLWDPNTFCGRPIYAQLQAAYFYPFRIPTVLLVKPSPHVRMLRALEIEMIAHIFLAGVFTLWLCRRLGMGGPAALLSAAAYQLGFFFFSQAEHIGFVETACWLPLAWLGVVLLSEKATLARFALLSGALAMTLLAGMFPLAIVVFVFVGMVAVVHAVFLRSGARILILTIAAGTTGLMLAAIQILPTIEMTFLSIGHLRSTLKYTGTGLPLAALKTLVWPNALGALTGGNPAYDITMTYLYCGVLVVALAVVAIFVKPSRAKFAVLALTLVSGIGMLGDSTPIGNAVYQMLPGFARGPYYPTSWMPVFSLCVALLSGFGLQFFQVFRGWAYAVVLLGAADLIWFGSGRQMNTLNYDPGSMVLDQAIDGETTALAAMRSATKSHFPPYRIDGRSDNAWGSWTLLTGVPSANGIDPLSPERLLRARQRLHTGPLWAISTIQIVEPKLLSLMNVRYLMSFEPLSESELQQSRFFLSRTFPGRYLYENPNVLPRFFFVEAVVPSSGENESLELINREGWDPARMAVVEGIDHSQQGLADGTVQVVKYANQEVILQVHAGGDGFLSSSELHYPGWVAYVDGKRVPVHYSNVAFRGIFLPPGDHSIVYKFRPASLMLGGTVTLLTLTALCIAFYRRKRTSGSIGQP